MSFDDQKLINKMNRRGLASQLGLHARHVTVYGDDEAETRGAVEHILQATPRPDVVLLDQCLDYMPSHSVSYLGTNIASDLADRSFEGFVVLCTASAPVFIREGRTFPGVNAIVDKNGVGNVAAQVIAAFWVWRDNQQVAGADAVANLPVL